MCDRVLFKTVFTHKQIIYYLMDVQRTAYKFIFMYITLLLYVYYCYGSNEIVTVMTTVL